MKNSAEQIINPETQEKKMIVVISNMDNSTYFFSKDHCQNHGMGDSFVPCTHYIPSRVVPRKSVPDGIIKNITDLVAVFYDDMVEIDNPNPNFKPKK